MTNEEQQKHFDQLVNKARSTMISKSSDYATEEDKLSNFKLAGGIIRISPEVNCLSAIANKVARLGVLLGKVGNPNNESILDSIEDLMNYSMLLHMLHVEHIQSSHTPIPAS